MRRPWAHAWLHRPRSTGMVDHDPLPRLWARAIDQTALPATQTNTSVPAGLRQIAIYQSQDVCNWQADWEDDHQTKKKNRGQIKWVVLRKGFIRSCVQSHSLPLTPLPMKPLGETSLLLALCSFSSFHDHSLDLPLSYKQIMSSPIKCL